MQAGRAMCKAKLGSFGFGVVRFDAFVAFAPCEWRALKHLHVWQDQPEGRVKRPGESTLGG